jgi:hypothetical protein
MKIKDTHAKKERKKFNKEGIERSLCAIKTALCVEVNDENNDEDFKKDNNNNSDRPNRNNSTNYSHNPLIAHGPPRNVYQD